MESSNQDGFIGNIYIKEEKILPDEEIKIENDNKIHVRSITSELNPNLKLPETKSGNTNQKKLKNNEDSTVNVKAEPFDFRTTDNSLINQMLSSNGCSFESLIRAQFEDASRMTKCDSCNKVFPNKYVLQSHQKKVHTGKFECKQCHRRFWKKQLLVIHLSDHTENPNFVLQQQLISVANDEGKEEETSKDPKLKEKPASVTNPILKTYQCDHCEKYFSTKETLNRHILKQKNAKPYDCPICDEKFNSEAQVKKHSLSHVNEGPFQCKGCEGKFEHPFYLLVHQKTHSAADRGVKPSEGTPTSDKEFAENIVNEHLNSCEGKNREEKISSVINEEQSNSGEKIPDDLCGVVKCLECGKKLKTENLSKHLNIHSREFKCKKCNEKFVEKSDYEQHMNIHTKKQPFECQICDRSFVWVKAYKAHMKIHGDSKCMYAEPAFECEECAKLFSNEVALKEHEIAAHSKDLKFECSECLKTFRTRRYLIVHIRGHSREKLHQCNECDRTYTTRWLLTLHRRTHTGEKPYHCSLCPRKFFFKNTLNDHINKHKGAKPFKCGHCDLRFWKKHALKRHFRVHTGEKPYKCEICNEAFRLSYNLKLHLGVHSDEKLYECKDCNKKFKRSAYLANHQKCHTKEKPHKCNVCKRKYRFKWQLNVHYKVHTGEGLHKCTGCDKSFVTSSSLKIHFRKHSGERPYKCGECEKAFKTNTVLKYHMRSHTGVKPFECKICNTGFTAKRSLERHLGTHTKQPKDYKCDGCSKSFKYKKNLTSHLRNKNHEKDNIIVSYQCAHCGQTFSDTTSFEDHQMIHNIKMEEPEW